MNKNQKPTTAQQFADKIKFFLNSHKATLEKIQSKLSSFFDMKIYNDVVRAYDQLGYICKPIQLQKNGSFKYKTSTNGYLENFSMFEIEKNGKIFWIVHNLKCESKDYGNSYITADICVINKNSHKRKKIDRQPIDYVPNSDLMTFFECKFMNPFPELIASFIGLVKVLTPELLNITSGKSHIAPSLVCANNGSINSYRFANSVKAMHTVNILNNMAYRTMKARIAKRQVKLIADRT